MLRIFLSVGVFLLTLAACMWATVAIVRGPIERDLAKRSLEVLEEIDGLQPDHLELQFVGRDGLLQGEVKSEELKKAAEEQLDDLYGARLIRSEIVVSAYESPWLVVKRTDETTVLIEGLLADADVTIESGELIDSLLSGDGNDIDFDVKYGERVEVAEWLDPFSELALILLSEAKDGRVAVRDGKLSMSGELPSGMDKQLIADTIAETKERFAGLVKQHDFALTVAEPSEPASFEMFPPQDGVIVVAGRFADLDAADELLRLMRLSGNWIIKDQIVVAENTSDAPWFESLTLLLPSVLSEVVSAGLKIEGDRLRLDGQISEDMLVAINDMTEQNFPAAEYDVTNRLRMMTPAREAMVSILTYPGKVELKGLLAENALKELIVSAVGEGMDGGELLTDELQIDPNVLEADWIDRLVALIPPYVKRVKRGGLTIYSNILAVEAVIESDADRDFIWAVTEQNFPDDKFRRLLELRFPEELESGIAGDAETPGEE